MGKSKKAINKSKKRLNKRKISKTKRRKRKQRNMKKLKIKKYRGGVRHRTPGTNYNGEGYYEGNNFIKHGDGTYERMINGLRWEISGKWEHNKLKRQYIWVKKFNTEHNIIIYYYEGIGSYDDDNLLIKSGEGTLTELRHLGLLTTSGTWENNMIHNSAMECIYEAEHMGLQKMIYNGYGSYDHKGIICKNGGIGTLSLYESIYDDTPKYEYEAIWQNDKMTNKAKIVVIKREPENKTITYDIVLEGDTNIIAEISLFDRENISSPLRERKGILTDETNNLDNLDLMDPLTFLERIQFGRKKYISLKDFTNRPFLLRYNPESNLEQENIAPVGRRE